MTAQFKRMPKGGKKSSGMTLVELSMAMLLGLMVCGMLMTLFNQQLMFLRIMNAQNFLIDEAPVINSNVSRIISQAERFRLHNSLADAVADINPVAPGSLASVVALQFRQPDGEVQVTYLEFNNTEKALYYYANGQTNAKPDWAVTKQAQNVEFFLDAGVLRMRLTGKNNEQITYAGAMQR